MGNDIGWELYRSLLGVLSEGSLSSAARAMGLTQPTVGRHIGALEKSLGVVLFTRSQSGLAPTEAAIALKPYAQAMQSTAAALKRTAESHGNGVRGSVRITASEVVAIDVLPPIIARLMRQHPALKVELVLTNRVQDLLHNEADIAVRTGEPTQESLIARSIGEIELGLHAHQSYLDYAGTPTSFQELEKHRLIGFDEETAYLRKASKAMPLWQRENFSARTNSDPAQLALIRAGAGIGVCQAVLAKRDALLVRLMPQLVSVKLPTWIAMHEDLRNSPRCRVTFDALVEGMREHVQG